MTRTEPAAALPALVCPACLQRMPLQRSREVAVWICPCGQQWLPRKALDVWMLRGIARIQRRVPTLHHPRLWKAKCERDGARPCPNCAEPKLQRYVGEGVDVQVCSGCRGLCVSAPALEVLVGTWRARANTIAEQSPAAHWVSGLFELLLIALRLA